MTNNSTLLAGSIHSSKDRLRAAQLVADGKVVGVFNRGVNALWLNPDNREAIRSLQKIKGEKRKNRPVALTISLDELFKMTDFNATHNVIKQFIEVSEDLKKELGSLCFIKVPLKKSYIKKIPKSALSRDDEGTFWIQSWDPHGHEPTEDLINLIQNIGIEYPAVTSMNVSGEPEIVDQHQARKFCQNTNIELYLADDKADPLIQGSYTIITFSKKGIELTRDGNIPGRVIEAIFGQPFITQGTKLPNYLQKNFPESLTEGLTKKQIRMAVLMYLDGGEPEEINHAVKKTN